MEGRCDVAGSLDLRDNHAVVSGVLADRVFVGQTHEQEQQTTCGG
jgi:hypothetical protein